MGILSELTVRFSADVSGAKSNIASLTSTVTQASSTFQSLSGAGNLSKVVTGEDVAAAKLTLLESKANEARVHLRELENAVDAGKVVLGIDQARAQLTILEGKAQDAREKLQAMGNEVVEETPKMASGIERVTSMVQEMSISIGHVGQEMASSSSSFAGHIGGMASGLLDFGSKLGMAAMGLQMLVQGAESVGEAFIGQNASMEQTDVAFKQLLGSSTAASDEMKDLQQFAASTPFQFPELADTTQKLLAFQFPLKDTRPLLTAIGDSLSALGEGTPAKLGQVVDVFGQMNSAGKLQTQDLMQLTSVGINGFQLLSDQMHKPVSVIKDMVTAGLIPAKDGIESLRAGMEKTFGGGMAAQAQTFNGLLSTFQDNVGSAWRAFTGPLFDQAKGALTNLGNLVSSPAFQKFAIDMGEKVGGAIKNVSSAVQNAVPWFQHLADAFKSPEFQTMQSAFVGLGVIISQQLMPFLQPLIDRFRQVFSPGNTSGADAIKNSFAGIRDVVNNLASFLQKVDLSSTIRIFQQVLQGTQQFLAPITNSIGSSLVPAVMNLAGAIAPVVTNFLSWIANSGIIVPLMAGLGTTISIIVTVISGLINGLTTVITFFTQTELGGAILKATLITLGIVIGIIAAIVLPGLIAGFVATAAAAIMTGISIALAFLPITLIVLGVIAVITLIILAVQHWGAIVAWLQAAWSAVVAFFVALWNAILAAVMSVGASIGGFLTGLWTGIVNIAVGFGQTLLNAFLAPFRAIGALFVWLYQHNTYFQALVDFIMSVTHTVVAFLQSAWSVAVNFVVGLWNGAVNMAHNAWSSVTGAISNAVGIARGAIVVGFNAAVTFLTGIWNTIVSSVTTAWQHISSIFSGAWNTYISTPLNTLKNNITDFFTGLATDAFNFGSNLINMLASGITNAAGAVGTAVQNAINGALSGAGFHDLPGMPKSTPGHARGILNSPTSHWAMVGENGPELMYVPQGSNIYPNGTGPNFSYGGASSGGGGGEQHIHVHIGNDEVAHYVTNEQMKMVRLGGYRR